MHVCMCVFVIYMHVLGCVYVHVLVCVLDLYVHACLCRLYTCTIVHIKKSPFRADTAACSKQHLKEGQQLILNKCAKV